MGAISANKPVITLVTGPMLTGSSRGTRVGACTDCRKGWASFRAGEIDIEDITALNDELAPSVAQFYTHVTGDLANGLTGRYLRGDGVSSFFVCVGVATIPLLPGFGANWSICFTLLESSASQMHAYKEL